MASRRGGRKWQAVRHAAYLRDKKKGAKCWICHQPIDYDADPGTPDAWEPDHVKPVAKFPELEFSLSNIRASHCSCNRSRGDGSGIDRIGSTSRRW